MNHFRWSSDFGPQTAFTKWEAALINCTIPTDTPALSLACLCGCAGLQGYGPGGALRARVQLRGLRATTAEAGEKSSGLPNDSCPFHNTALRLTIYYYLPTTKPCPWTVCATGVLSLDVSPMSHVSVVAVPALQLGRPAGGHQRPLHRLRLPLRQALQYVPIMTSPLVAVTWPHDAAPIECCRALTG